MLQPECVGYWSRALTFWFSGVRGIISFINTGKLSVILRSPLAWAAPAATHCLVIESMMYRTPSLWVAGLFLNADDKVSTRYGSTYGEAED
jgi:hypothetical protein